LLKDNYVNIHSFEPIKQNYNHLNYNLSGFANIKMYNNALSDKKEQIKMINNIPQKGFNAGMCARFDTYINTLSYNKKYNENQREYWRNTISKMNVTEIVDAITVDSLRLKPSLIKIDVEGDELKVIMGAIKTIKNHSPVLYVEDNCDFYSEELQNLLKTIGYSSVSEHPWIHIKN